MSFDHLRASRRVVLMQIAGIMSQRSTCTRAEVGAVIARDGRIIATGYNGAPAGLPHCLEAGCSNTEDSQGCSRTVHAEANAIAFAARHGVATEGAELFCTHAPCLDCAKLIVNAGIVKVIYGIAYRNPSGTDLLHNAGIPVHRWDNDDDAAES